MTLTLYHKFFFSQLKGKFTMEYIIYTKNIWKYSLIAWNNDCVIFVYTQHYTSNVLNRRTNKKLQKLNGTENKLCMYTYKI